MSRVQEVRDGDFRHLIAYIFFLKVRTRSSRPVLPYRVPILLHEGIGAPEDTGNRSPGVAAVRQERPLRYQLHLSELHPLLNPRGPRWLSRSNQAYGPG